MKIIDKIKNKITKDEEVGLMDRELLEWLGISKGERDAVQEITYFTCLKTLSESMGKLPLKFRQEDEKGGKRKADLTSMAERLIYRPNPLMTPTTFWTSMELNCQHYGNAYAWIQTRFKPKVFGGEYETVAIWPMQPQCVTILIDDSEMFSEETKLFYKYNDPRTGTEYVFPAENVLHFKNWMTWDGIVGKSAREILRTTINGANMSQEYQENLYASGLTASSVLQYTADIDESRRRKLQKTYNDILTGAKNAGKVVAMPQGMTLTPLEYKLTDAQYFELKKYTAVQIAAAFGVTPNQLNDYEKSSYANSEQQQLTFLINTMLFRITQYEQEINWKCLTSQERADGLEYKFNEKVLLRTNNETQIETITQGIQNGLYTPNEGRNLLDLPSEDGGDELIVNGNYVPLKKVGAAYGV